jgi:uncharacterized protein (DUF1697 family)
MREGVRYGAFLRGINLGSRRRVAAADLRSWFEEMGFRDVSTFRTSGNVAFSTGRQPRAKITLQIEAVLEEALGFEVAAFLRTEKELRAIARKRPFPSRVVEDSDGKMQVALLSAKPTRRLQEKVLALGTESDRLAFADLELYWLPSGGTRDSELDYGEIEQLLGPTTRRTEGTLVEMVEKHFSTSD